MNDESWLSAFANGLGCAIVAACMAALVVVAYVMTTPAKP